MTETGKFEVAGNSEQGYTFPQQPPTAEVSYTFSPTGTWGPDKNNSYLTKCTAAGVPSLQYPQLQDGVMAGWKGKLHALKYPKNTIYVLVAVNNKTGMITEVGKETTIVIKPGETLNFSLNDCAGAYANNGGSITVEWKALTLTPTMSAPVQKLQPSDSQRSNEFGWSVAICGAWAIARALNADTPGKADAGAAYILQLRSGSWAQVAKLQPSDLGGDAWFGHSIAISGEWAITGAARAPAQGQGDAGAAYIFELRNGSGAQVAKLQPSDLQGAAMFGSSVAISGEWAIIGARGARAAYIFQLRNGTWAQVAKLQPSNLQGEAAQFGESVAISGEWAIIGANGASAPNKPGAGAAHIFQLRNSGWVQVEKLQPSDLQMNSYFGTSVAISGEWAIAGAHFANVSGHNHVGVAYIFQLRNGSWAQVAKLQPSDLRNSSYFGRYVAISGEWVIVREHNTVPAYIFQLRNGSWQQVRKLQPSDLQVDDRFGNSVAISWDLAIAGGFPTEGDTISSLAAYIFKVT